MTPVESRSLCSNGPSQYNINPLLANACNTHAANSTGSVFCQVHVVIMAMQRAIHGTNNNRAVLSVLRGQLSVGDSHRKLVVEEELEVSL
jgi:hypothetical protein